MKERKPEPTGLKKFNIILNWCKEHTPSRPDSYCIKEDCWNELLELDTVTEEDIVCCYKLLGYKVSRAIQRKGFYGRWYISNIKEKKQINI